MPSVATPPLSEPKAGGSPRLAAFEVAWILLIFFLAAGTPPPDAGESHYWVKAKHYWQPEWCAGDLFLESQDAHLAFDWALGWVTKFTSLSAAVWISRGVVWGLLAWAWRRLSWAIVPVPLGALLTAGLMLLLARHGNMARELVMRGGVEAKTLAYVFVFLALDGLARANWRAALLWAGFATAFHVLVGGWTTVAIAFAWLLSGQERPRLVGLLLWVIAWFLLAGPGLLPALELMRGADPAIAREAARIYVFERLPHHLVFHTFEPWLMARFGLLTAAWGVMAWLLRKEGTLWRVGLVAGGALALALAGILIDQGFVARANLLGQTSERYQESAAPLLRYYWFRLADVLIPAVLALGLVLGIQRLSASRPKLASWLLIFAILAAAGDLASTCYERAMHRMPGAAIQQHLADPAHFDHWRAACRWIAEHTPPDAQFITPRQQQTFKWYAGRAEIVTWKDIPQDAQSIVRWRKAIADLYPDDPAHRRADLGAFTDAELVALAKKYEATYIVIDRTKSRRPIALERVYPDFAEENPAFAVYRVPAKMSP